MRQVTESRLQQECVIWFHNSFPQYRGLLFSVPNGGKRTAREAYRLKQEGAVAGVSDLILLIGGTATLIEMKTATGHQQPNQADWQRKVEKEGFSYYICRSVEQFKEIIWRVTKQKTEV